MHDKNFKRTCGVDKNSWEAEYDEIRTYDAGSLFSEDFAGEKIPLLDDVIDYAKYMCKHPTPGMLVYAHSYYSKH